MDSNTNGLRAVTARMGTCTWSITIERFTRAIEEADGRGDAARADALRLALTAFARARSQAAEGINALLQAEGALCP